MYLEVNYSCVLRWAGAGGGAAWLAGICSVVRSRSSSEDVTGALRDSVTCDSNNRGYT